MASFWIFVVFLLASANAQDTVNSINYLTTIETMCAMRLQANYADITELIY
jgi:hypothetical protein